MAVGVRSKKLIIFFYPSLMDSASIPELTADERADILRQWTSYPNYFTDKAIVSDKAIDQNPALMSVIEEIRDGYLRLLNIQRYAIAAKEIAADQSSEIPAPALKEANDFLNDTAYDLATHTNRSFARLQESDTALGPRDAARLMGRIISATTGSFDMALKCNYFINIPRIPFEDSPEQHGLHHTATPPAPPSTTEENQWRGWIRHYAQVVGNRPQER